MYISFYHIKSCNFIACQLVKSYFQDVHFAIVWAVPKQKVRH